MFIIALAFNLSMVNSIFFVSNEYPKIFIFVVKNVAFLISSLPNKNSAPKILYMTFSFDVTRKFAHTNKLFPSGVTR